MPGLEAIRRIVERVSARLTARRHAADFTCGDCDISERCGLPPSDKCVERAAQIADGRRKSPPGYMTDCAY